MLFNDASLVKLGSYIYCAKYCMKTYIDHKLCIANDLTTGSDLFLKCLLYACNYCSFVHILSDYQACRLEVNRVSCGILECA